MTWQEVAADFAFDGALRDIYIFDTDLGDWQRVLDLLREQNRQASLSYDGHPAQIPTVVATVFSRSREQSPTLSVLFDRIVANCHFFTEKEFEFDVDPRDVKGQLDLDSLIRFMRWLATAVRKEVVLTPENRRGSVILRVHPG